MSTEGHSISHTKSLTDSLNFTQVTSETIFGGSPKKVSNGPSSRGLLFVLLFGTRREFKGQQNRGNRASERKSASERVSEREGSERFLRGFERF